MRDEDIKKIGNLLPAQLGRLMVWEGPPLRAGIWAGRAPVGSGQRRPVFAGALQCGRPSGARGAHWPLATSHWPLAAAGWPASTVPRTTAAQ